MLWQRGWRQRGSQALLQGQESMFWSNPLILPWGWSNRQVLIYSRTKATENGQSTTGKPQNMHHCSFTAIYNADQSKYCKIQQETEVHISVMQYLWIVNYNGFLATEPHGNLSNQCLDYKNIYIPAIETSQNGLCASAKNKFNKNIY